MQLSHNRREVAEKANLQSASRRRAAGRALRAIAVIAVFAPLLGACGDDRDDVSVVSVDDPRGYSVDPTSYLGAAQLQALAKSRVPVVVPTWLPEWTRGITPVAFVLPSGGYIVSWQVPLRSDEDLRRHPIVMKLREGIDLRITGEVNPLSPNPPDWPKKVSPSGRTYLWQPENDLCNDRDDIAEAVMAWQPEGKPTVEYQPPPTGPPADTDEPQTDDDTVIFPPPARYPYYYTVTLGPQPACSAGEFAVTDMFSFADSNVSL
ncbi:MAG TPA: hypothetical protein VK988_10480 [Acidimicrobiales bacterium]|nr:hypothetical protein [Acidimicrobiales bacterium]